MKIVLSGPIKGVSKSHALWVEDGTTCTPIVFFRKPKWVTNNDAWVQFVRGACTMISAEGQAALNEMLESAALAMGPTPPSTTPDELRRKCE